MSSEATAPRVVHVVDDDLDVRKSLEQTLQSVGYEVRMHATAQEFLDQFDPAAQICLVVDLLLPGNTGLQLCREVAQSAAHCAFILISGHGDVPTVVEAMRLGAVDFLEKPFSRQGLLEAVHRAFNLAAVRQTQKNEEASVTEGLSALSPREQEVFAWMSEGLVTKEIAARLQISPRTVDVHRSKIAQKLRIDSPTQLGRVMYLKQRHQDRQEKI